MDNPDPGKLCMAHFYGWTRSGAIADYVYCVRFRWRSGFVVNNSALPVMKNPALQAIAAIPDPSVSFPSIALMTKINMN